MSLETDLRTVLAAVCPRVYPDVAPPATLRPYVTWQQIGGTAPAYVDDAVPSLRNAYVQVNVWADTRLEASALMLQIETALTTAQAFSARPQAAMIAAHSDDDDTRGAQQDFTVWATR